MTHDDIAEFRALHAAAGTRRGLSPADAERYAVLSERLWQRVLVASNAAVGASYEQARTGVRSRRAVRVDLTWGAVVHRAITVDVGTGGFAALLAAAPPRKSAVLAKLHLGHGEGITVMARVAGAKERRGTARVSFAFTDVSPSEQVRLQRFVLNDALADAALGGA